MNMSYKFEDNYMGLHSITLVERWKLSCERSIIGGERSKYFPLKCKKAPILCARTLVNLMLE